VGEAVSILTTDPPRSAGAAGDAGESCAGRAAGAGPAGRRWLAGGLVAAGVIMTGWLFVLAARLPATATAWHWPLAWTGLDALEALGLLMTGRLLARRDDRYRLAAVATATLLAVDAWFDVTTAAPGSQQLTAVAMAACPELPVAALCLTLALRGQPGRQPAGPGRGGRSPRPAARGRR